MCVVGGSGSCKTTFSLDLIYKMDKTFSEVVFVVKSKDEPYYKHLDSDEIKRQGVQVFEGLKNMSNHDKSISKDLKLLKLDDHVTDKRASQGQIVEAYTRARNKGYCSICIAQYFLGPSGVPTGIRLNSNYVVLKRHSHLNSFVRVTQRNYNRGISMEQILELCDSITDPSRLSFLLIDIDHPEMYCRKHWDEVVDM